MTIPELIEQWKTKEKEFTRENKRMHELDYPRLSQAFFFQALTLSGCIKELESVINQEPKKD